MACCGKSKAPPPRASPPPKNTEVKKPEPPPTDDEPAPIKERAGSQPAPKMKEAEEKKEEILSERKEERVEPQKQIVDIPIDEMAESKHQQALFEEYKTQPQPYDPEWDPTAGTHQEKDLTRGKRIMLLIYNNSKSHFAIFNNSPDLEMTVRMQFDKCMMEPLVEEAKAKGTRPPKEIQEEGSEWPSYEVTVFPGQTAPLVKTVPPYHWDMGYSLSYSYGPVTDKEYLSDLANKISANMVDDLEMMDEIARSKGLDPANVPAPNSSGYDPDILEEMAEAVLTHPSRGPDTQYVDLAFPPQQSSISDDPEAKQMCWLRPDDYLKNLGLKASLFVKGSDESAIDPGDIDQGCLGDCWLMAAIAACAEFPQDLVLPLFRNHDDILKYAEYNIWHVKLAKDSWFQWHTLDGYLPCHPVPGAHGPCFAHNKEQPNELWVSLIEKAYARLHGNYYNIASGDPAVGLSAITGYPNRSLDWKLPSEDLFKVIKYHDEQQHLIFICSPGVDVSDYMGDARASEEAKAKAELYASMGLVTGHAYTLLSTYEWNNNGEICRLVKIRNPWGTGSEWTGRFRDDDPVWAEETEETHELLIGTGKDKEAGGKQDDGTWWMLVEDMQRMFGSGGACFVNLNWWDLRIKTALNSNFPTHVLEVCPSEDVDALAWVTQTDKRGLAEGDPRRDYAALRVEVILPKPDDEGETVAVSGKGVFLYGNSMVAFENTEEADFDGYFPLKGGNKYYLFCRGHPHESRPHVANKDDLVMAVMTSAPCNMRVLEFSEGMKESFQYRGYFGFSADDASPATDFKVQVNKTAVAPSDVPWDDMSSCEHRPSMWTHIDPRRQSLRQGRRFSMQQH